MNGYPWSSKLSLRLPVVCAATCSALVMLAGCAPNSMDVVRETQRSWDTDLYVPPTDPSGVRKNAARILAKAESPQQRVMTVGSRSAVVFDQPSVRAKPLGQLRAGDAVRVTLEASYVRIAPQGKPTLTAANMSEYVGTDASGAQQEVSPSWVKVDAGSVQGWVAARSLVNPIETATSLGNMLVAQEAAAEGVDGKGFSEKVKLKSTAMKGGLGDVAVKDANFDAADALLSRCEAPPDLHVSRYPPFSPMPRLQQLPAVGQPLSSVDPKLADEVNQATLNASMGGQLAAGADAVSQGSDLMGQLGFGGAESTKTAAEAVKVAAQVLAEHPLTAEEERMISRLCLAQAVGSTPYLPPEHPISAYVNWVGGWVAAQSSLPYPASGLDFVVLEDRSTVNAMAMPGGPILVTTGMLEFLQSEDELAFLLGHEMAHVEERHAFKQLNDNRLIRKLASLMSINNLMATGKFDGFLSAVMARGSVPASLQPEINRMVRSEARDLLARVVDAIRDTAINQIVNAADQGIETAADLRGLSLAAAAGYNPAAVEPLLERFRSFRGDYGGAKYSDNRLAEARLVIPKLPSRDGGRCKTLEELGGQVVPSSEAQKNWANLQRLLAAR